MGRGLGAPSGRRAWLAGRVTVLLITVIAGVLAIVHYSSWGLAIAGTTQHPLAAGTHRAGATAARHVTFGGPGAKTGGAAGPQSAAPTAGSAAAHPAKTSASRSASPDHSAAPAPSQSPAPKAPSYFRTLPTGAKLPSGAQCAQW